jgi:hypothetical protein
MGHADPESVKIQSAQEENDLFRSSRPIIEQISEIPRSRGEKSPLEIRFS